MKKFFLHFFLLIAGTVLFFALFYPEPPKPVLLVNNESLPYKAADYGIVSDSPDDLVKDMPYFPVQPDAQVTIKLPEQASTISGGLWKHGATMNKITDNTIQLPKVEGKYIYIFKVQWENKGNVLYVFPFKVK